MSLRSVELKQIDQRTKDIIFGFIRQYQTEINNEDIIIPPLVIFTCLAFFWIREYFELSQIDATQQIITLSEDKLQITKTQRNGWNNITLGSMCIKSTSQCIAKWTFMINELGDKNSLISKLVFGIVNGVPKKPSFWNKSGHYMLCDGGNAWRDGDWHHNHQQFKQGNKLQITLDLKQAKIEFDIDDGKHTETLFNNIAIDETITYRIAVALRAKKSVISLLHFECV